MGGKAESGVEADLCEGLHANHVEQVVGDLSRLASPPVAAAILANAAAVASLSPTCHHHPSAKTLLGCGVRCVWTLATGFCSLFKFPWGWIQLGYLEGVERDALARELAALRLPVRLWRVVVLRKTLPLLLEVSQSVAERPL